MYTQRQLRTAKAWLLNYGGSLQMIIQDIRLLANSQISQPGTPKARPRERTTWQKWRECETPWIPIVRVLNPTPLF